MNKKYVIGILLLSLFLISGCSDNRLDTFCKENSKDFPDGIIADKFAGYRFSDKGDITFVCSNKEKTASKYFNIVGKGEDKLDYCKDFCVYGVGG